MECWAYFFFNDLISYIYISKNTLCALIQEGFNAFFVEVLYIEVEMVGGFGHNPPYPGFAKEKISKEHPIVERDRWTIWKAVK